MEITLDSVATIVQIGFWAVSGTIVVLTYLRARKSVLSTVNSEYQKRVMDRLQKLSEQLYEEFDEESEHYWAKRDWATETVGIMNEIFLKHKEYFLREKRWLEGVPIVTLETRLSRLLNPLASDPFVPKEIKTLVVTFMKERLDVMRDVYHECFGAYGDGLAKGKIQPATLAYCMGLHNEINQKLFERGCGVEHIQEEVHGMRQAIQKYFESFDPR